MQDDNKRMTLATDQIQAGRWLMAKIFYHDRACFLVNEWCTLNNGLYK